MNWVRLWVDMPTDPKWRVIAKKSGRPVSEVIAVYVAMLTNAGASERNRTQPNATERGELSGWSDEDTAAALDTDTEAVTAIRAAMQGKVLDGDRLTGWDKRQPNREDGAAERARAFRERNRTQPNATERPDTDTEKNRKDEKKKHPEARERAGGGEVDQVIESWNALAESCDLPRSLGSEKVRRLISTRLKRAGWLDAFIAALPNVGGSAFHRGKNDTGWRANLEWLLQDGKAEEMATKVPILTAQERKLNLGRAEPAPQTPEQIEAHRLALEEDRKRWEAKEAEQAARDAENLARWEKLTKAEKKPWWDLAMGRVDIGLRGSPEIVRGMAISIYAAHCDGERQAVAS